MTLPPFDSAPVAPRLNPLELAELHLDALYERDVAGLITASRDPEVAAPPFHLVRTAGGNRWLLAAALPGAKRNRIASILSAQLPISDCADAQAHPPDVEAVRAALAEHAPLLREYRGPAFFFRDDLPTPERAEMLVDLRDAPHEGAFAWLGSASEVAHPIVIVRAHNGEVASVCYSARSSAAAAEAGVETMEEYRGRGYGSLAVVAWATAVRESGRVPLYSTPWENAASRALARRLGLVCYGEDLHIG